jgi:IclR family transcriptional regulator, acetate operon repressor
MKRRPSRPTVVSTARYTVDAAAKALELLSVFSFREPRLSLADLAQRTGIPRATAFRLLSTLEQAGFLVKIHGAYQLGIKCFVLGNIVAGGLDLRETAHPHLVALRDATRETTQIAILDHWQVVYLERMLSPYPAGFMRSRAGAILPAYCTGLGKTLLAFRPEAEVAAWAATQKFPALTRRTITSARRLLQELRAIRERGYGVDDQEREAGVQCLAAPIRNHTGEVVAAISVAGPIERMPRPLEGSDLVDAVVAAARAISIDLGHVEETGLVHSFRAAAPAHGGHR